MKKGFFISFEGGEGSGKSIQVKLLADFLRQKGYQVVLTREPGGTKIGEQIRQITHSLKNKELTFAAEVYLMAASRAQNVAEVILPALKKGKIVIADRFLDSSLAYQGYGRGLGEKTIADLNKLAVGSLKPDLTILLDVGVKKGLARRKKAKKIDRLDLEKKSFYQKVRQGYFKLAKKNPSHYLVISAEKPIEEIAKIIRSAVPLPSKK